MSAAAGGSNAPGAPLLEYVESLLTGSGRDLDLRTFKLVDQISGRTMGVRADIAPQVARIDAHLLNRKGVTRLCYCGSVLHTLPAETPTDVLDLAAAFPGTRLLVIVGQDHGDWPAVLETNAPGTECYTPVDLGPAAPGVSPDPLEDVRVYVIGCP